MTDASVATPPDARRFSARDLDMLYAAVQVDDVVDADTVLPARITCEHDARDLVDCFRICHQLWREGAGRDAILALVRGIRRDGDLDAGDRARFKDVRAKFKQLRFAFTLYDARHRCPPLLDRLTITMGSLQDALTHRDRRLTTFYALALRLMLSAPVAAILTRQTNRFRPASPADFRRYVDGQVATLRETLAGETVTGAHFHETRKIVSRQVSFYDTLRTIRPSVEAQLMSRALAAINGLMGRGHDELVARRKAGTQDYHHDRFVLPRDIRRRLTDFVERYDRSCAADPGDAGGV